MSHQFEYAVFRGIQRALLLMPLKSVQRIGAAVGAVAFFLAGNRRRIALENLQNAFPEKKEWELRRIARGAFQSYAISLMEFLWVPKLDSQTLGGILSTDGLEVIRECHSRGKGIVVVSAHLGNWELVALGLSYAVHLPVSIIVQTQNNLLVDQAINALRTTFGNAVIPMGIAVRDVVRALREGEVVAFAADQSGPEQGPFIDFFGRRVATHQGPALFALKTGAPLVMVLCIRNSNGTYRGIIEEIRTNDLAGPTAEHTRALTERYTHYLESVIRRHPEQWLWMHRRWKHLAPPSGDAMEQR